MAEFIYILKQSNWDNLRLETECVFSLCCRELLKCRKDGRSGSWDVVSVFLYKTLNQNLNKFLTRFKNTGGEPNTWARIERRSLAEMGALELASVFRRVVGMCDFIFYGSFLYWLGFRLQSQESNSWVDLPMRLTLRPEIFKISAEAQPPFFLLVFISYCFHNVVVDIGMW